MVPEDYHPIPPGFNAWGGNVAFALPLAYAGTAATEVLELWTNTLDFWSLSSAASRAEASARNYTLVAPLARLLATASSDPNANTANTTLVFGRTADQDAFSALCVGAQPAGALPGPTLWPVP